MFRQIVNRRSASFLRQSDHVCSGRRQSLHRQSFYSLDALSRRNTNVSRPQVPVSKMCPLINLARAMSSGGPESPEQKTGVVKKFKQMFKDYWYVLIPVHVATSVVWFGGFYIMLKSGVDIVGALEFVGTSEKLLGFLRNSEAGYYALSYACYKIATPFRYTVTVGGTTVAISKLQHTGYLKSTSEFAEKFKENKEKIREDWKQKKYNVWEHIVKKKD